MALLAIRCTEDRDGKRNVNVVLHAFCKKREKKKEKKREKCGEVSRGRLGKSIIVKFNLIHGRGNVYSRGLQVLAFKDIVTNPR